MAHNLTSLLNPFNERTTFVYDALNRANTITHANTTKAEHDYNAAGWLTALRNLKSDNSVISIFTYTYDNAANRLSMSEANGDRVTWTYDALYQLTRERRSGTNSFDITYTYDPVGNRLTKLQSGTTTTYTYDSANELTTEQAGATVTTYSFDNNGNTTLKNAAGQRELAEFDTTYTWDKENRMTKLEQPTSPAVMTFTYDANSFRRTLHDGTSLTKFLNDWVTGMPGIDPILIETDGSDSTIVTYTPALLHGLLSLTRHPSLVTHWYHYEAIGSTRQLTDASQIVTDTYTYEAFGKEVVTSGATVNALRYVGRLNYNTDGKSGLVVLGVRPYEPMEGRFTTKDPIMEGHNWFVYVGSNPVNVTDPTGLQWPVLPIGEAINAAKDMWELWKIWGEVACKQLACNIACNQLGIGTIIGWDWGTKWWIWPDENFDTASWEYCVYAKVKVPGKGKGKSKVTEEKVKVTCWGKIESGDQETVWVKIEKNKWVKCDCTLGKTVGTWPTKPPLVQY